MFLAQNGFRVDAVDISDVALKNLSKFQTNINLICTDLELFDIPENRYSLILNIKFLDRRLFPQIINGLVAGGVLIFETYLENSDNSACSMNRDHLLRPNELLHAFQQLHIIYFKESMTAENGENAPLASLVAVNRKDCLN